MTNILVIDENKEQRSALLTLFGEMGHTATEAWDGSNAAHKADQITFDLIVSSLAITKMTILHFLKSLRVGKTNKATPVILYAKTFEEDVVASLTRFGRVQFVTSPIDKAALAEKVSGTIKAAAVASREQDAKQKVYTFSKAALESCAKVSVETVERDFFRFNPDMLQQVDPAGIDFGIWMKGTKDLLEYVGSKFKPEENVKHVGDILGVLQRLKGGLGLYVRIAEKDKLYEHVHKVRLARMSSKNLQDTHKEAAELFNRLTMCSTRFNSADVDQQVLTSAEQVSMDMMQRLSDKPELIGLLLDLLRKDPQMFDFMALVNITAVSIGRKLGLQDVILKKLSLGCFFHDVGLALINMPLIVDREMTADEATLYRDHPSVGTNHLNSMEARGVTLPEEVFIIMMQHHEKFNGTGFPNQKKGRMSKENPTGIHLLASIVAVADRFAMYLLNETKSGSVDQNRIVAGMHRLTGEFDPAVLKAFKEVFASNREGTLEWQPTT